MSRFFILFCVVFMGLFPIKAQVIYVGTHDSIPSLDLNEVIVAGEKPQVKAVAGRVSVDLPHLVKDKAVTNIYEALAYLPGITVDSSGDLSLAGATELHILINGKLPSMPADNVIAWLQSYPIERLKNVEILYSTPAKYHVDGASINILLQAPSVLDGLQGQVRIDYEQQHNAKGGAHFAGTYATENWTADAMYHYTSGKSWAHELMDSRHSFQETVEQIRQDERTVNNGQSHNGYIGLEGSLGSGNKLSAAYNFQISPVRFVRNHSTGTLGTYLTDGTYPSSKKFHHFNVEYESSFGLSLGGSYTDYGEARATTLTDTQSAVVLQDYTSRQKIRRARFHADQAHGIGDWTLNYGASLDYSRDYSSQTFQNEVADDFASRLKEYATDLYVGAEGSFAFGLSLSASLKGNYYHRGDDTQWRFSPQIALTYLKNPAHLFQLNVSSSPSYPSYWEI